jgi:DNA-binding NarL/FixJ family response regulator
MDLHLGDEDGLALIQDLRRTATRLRIVVFTALAADVYAARCLQAGAHAFVGKRDSVTMLFRAIRDAAGGSITMPAGLSGRQAGGVAGRGQAGDDGVAAGLTNRELQVFRLVGQALATKQVAAQLGVSVKTVETHRENIKNKLGLDSHAELVARAAQWLRESGGA